MNIINMPPQSGRTTKLLNEAVRAAKSDGVSVVVVPTISYLSFIRRQLMDIDEEAGKHVVVMPFGRFIHSWQHALPYLRGRETAKIFIDDLDSCLNAHTGGYATVDTVVFEDKTRRSIK